MKEIFLQYQGRDIFTMSLYRMEVDNLAVAYRSCTDLITC